MIENSTDIHDISSEILQILTEIWNVRNFDQNARLKFLIFVFEMFEISILIVDISTETSEISTNILEISIKIFEISTVIFEISN